MSNFSLNVNETDDDFFGTLESRSNLANLFDVTQSSGDGNQSLKYRPPKEIKKSLEVAGSTDAGVWSVQVAKVVSAFKLINKENVSQGRVGLALLKNSQGYLKTILYRSKTNVLATLTLQAGSKLTLKLPYLQFHDDTNQFWSIFLETSDEKSFVDHLPSEFVSKVEQELDAPKTPIEAIETHSEDSDTTAKAKLLSRMAKMGQPLPKLATPSTTTDLSDSSDTEVINIPPKPTIVPRIVTKQVVPVNNAVQPANFASYTSQPQVLETQYMNVLLSENRTQNTEIRMNLSKLEMKIERVLDKIDLIGLKEPAQNEKKDKDDEIVRLEEKILELRKENRSLRQTCRELEAKVVVPEIRNAKVKTEMFSGFEMVLRDLDVEPKDGMDLEDVTMDVLEKTSVRINELTSQCHAKDKQITNYKMETEDLTKKIAAIRNETASIEKENQDLKQELIAARSESNSKLETVVKQIMNNLYRDIIVSLESSDKPLNMEAVLQLCGSAIRKETINAIEENTKKL